MKISDLKTIGIIGISAFALHKIGFFKSDFALWNMGKTQEFSEHALKGVQEGAKEATQDAIKSTTSTLDTGARVFVPGWAQLKAIEDMRAMFSDWAPSWATKQKTQELTEEERVLLAPKETDIPSNTTDAIRHIQEATGSAEPTGAPRRTTKDIQRPKDDEIINMSYEEQMFWFRN